MNSPEYPVNFQAKLGYKKTWLSLRYARYFSQIGMIVGLILIPLLGIFRIDVSSGFIVLGRQVWFSDFSLVFGLWLSLACLLVLFYSMAGTAFCGWLCPQNTVSGIANAWTAKHLGKRAVIDWEGQSQSKIASNKNSFLNWIFLTGKLLLLSLIMSLIPLFYFFPPEAVWSFVTFQNDDRLAGSLHWIYMVFAVILFVNIAVVRHYACRFMCIYRMWQYLFKTKDALHIDYDETRSDDCEKCNYCVKSCMVEIDPTKTSFYDSCTNCGACIVACNELHAKKQSKGLLSFKLGKRRNVEHNSRFMNSRLSNRLFAVLPFFLVGSGLFIWGLMSYQPYHFSVYRADNSHGEQIYTYRINLASKLYKPGEVSLRVDGIDPQFYSLSKQKISFNSVGRYDVELKINSQMAAGLHTILITAESTNGWQHSERLQHFVSS
ncbi:MAG: 4Fe-4S binding protein [Gammaproteobacteria bacterium]|nr:4Fe-4S binding protein [Gammaproteobacteria bacterium]